MKSGERTGIRVSRCLALLLSITLGAFVLAGCSSVDWERFDEVERQIKAANSAKTEAEAFHQMARWITDDRQDMTVSFILSCEDESGNPVDVNDAPFSKRTDLILTIEAYPQSEPEAARIIRHKVFDAENIGILMMTE